MAGAVRACTYHRALQPSPDVSLLPPLGRRIRVLHLEQGGQGRRGEAGRVLSPPAAQQGARVLMAPELRGVSGRPPAGCHCWPCIFLLSYLSIPITVMLWVRPGLGAGDQSSGSGCASDSI